jgi:hypothetical protein
MGNYLGLAEHYVAAHCDADFRRRRLARGALREPFDPLLIDSLMNARAVPAAQEALEQRDPALYVARVRTEQRAGGAQAGRARRGALESSSAGAVRELRAYVRLLP